MYTPHSIRCFGNNDLIHSIRANKAYLDLIWFDLRERKRETKMWGDPDTKKKSRKEENQDSIKEGKGIERV